MRAIDRCVYKELTGPLFISLSVLTFLVFTHQMGNRFAEMLIRKSADPRMILQLCLALLPSILIFTVPLAFLIATLIAFSRLSSDSEIIAMRSCGVSTLRLLHPVLKTGFLVFIAAAAMTLSLLPTGNRRLLELREQIGIRPVISEIKPRVFNEDISNMVLYVEDIQYQQGVWNGVFVVDNTAPNEQRIILAKHGKIVHQPETGSFQLHFEDGTIYKTENQDLRKDNLSRFGTLEVSVRLTESASAHIRPLKADERTTLSLIRDPGRNEKERLRSMVELHRRMALPLATFAFAMLGVALGINTRRGGRAYGFIIGILIAFSYFIIFVSLADLAKNGSVPVWIGVWGSNILIYCAAIWAIRRVERESRLIKSIMDNPVVLKIAEFPGRLARMLQSRNARRSEPRNGAILRLRLSFLKIVDMFLIREFFRYFSITLMICVGLFVLFTLIELMSDIVRTQPGPAIVLDYFWYLLPHILTLVVPMSVLIGSLVSFGLMDRTNQITALKASGISVYRLAVPMLLSAAMLSSFLFVLQDYVLPFANQKQDNLRHIIKGQPVQTFYHPERQWIFGQKNRLYNYVHYDASRREFAQISLYELDISENKYYRRTYADRAAWDTQRKGWVFYNGFVRNFNDPARGLVQFEQQFLQLPEGPSYFAKEVKESAKMTYLELKNHIRELQQAGFDVEELRVELYKKISFPVVSIIMAMIGIPFAFSMGRRGTLQGLAVSILIGMIYWGAFGVFEVMGGSGLLAPLLAAWAPNLLFGIGGLYLLFTIST